MRFGQSKSVDQLTPSPHTITSHHHYFTQTFAFLSSVVAPSTRAVAAFHASGRVHALPLFVAAALVFEALVDV